MSGGIPVSKGQVDPVFTNLLNSLQTQADTIAKAANGQGPRIWQMPPGLRTPPSDIPNLVNGFNRDSLNKSFASLIQDAGSPGTVGDVIGVKTQVDYVGMLDRAFRARHATPVRCLVHAAARRAGHGNAAGIFSDASGVVRYVSDALAAGKAQTGYVGPTSGGSPTS